MPPTLTGQYDSTATVTSVGLFADCPQRYYPTRQDEDPERDEIDATELGNQVHALLAGGARNGASPEALSLVARFEASDLGRQARGAARAEREFDFLMAIEDVVLRG